MKKSTAIHPFRLSLRQLLLPVFAFILLYGTATRLAAQTTLAPGDLAFLSLKVSGDGFAFLTFKDLCPRTVIYFTDNPYRNSGGFCTSREEFCISLTVTTLIPAGTQISYSDGAPGTFTIPSGAGTIAFAFNSEAGNNNGFSSSGDNCFAFQGTYLNPSFICGIKTSAYNSTGTVTCTDRAHTELPSALTLGTNALFLNIGSSDGIYYNCSVTSGTTAALRSAINNSANWTAGTSTITRPCTFTVSDAVAATCTVSCTCNIWSEDFNTTRYPSRAVTGANSNTTNPASDWTTTATDCDDGTPFGTVNQSYWGTLSGSFQVNDVEGGPCSCSTGGTTLNEWVTEVIDISGYANVSACVSFTNTGTLELNSSTASCNNADDIIQGQYRLNGGPWVSWFFDDGAVNLSPATVTGLNGSTLELRIYTGNKANDEFYAFDNVCVTGTPVVLPVEFRLFEATMQSSHHAVLNWITGSENNNDLFIVEKSTGTDSWNRIGEVNGHGTTSQLNSYTFFDYNVTAGTTYYRLRQVDYNGQFSYSAIRSVTDEEAAPLSLHPNPADASFTVTGMVPGQINFIRIYDYTGKLAEERITEQPTITFGAELLAPGIYFVQVTCGEQVTNLKLVRSAR